MILDIVGEARIRERLLEARALEISHRMQWHDAHTVERLERKLGAARGRLRLTTNPVTEGR